MQASKETPNAYVPCAQSMQSNVQVSASISHNQKLSAIYHKVSHMPPEIKLHRHVDSFLNKPMEVEYYMDRNGESKVKLKFLKSFENLNLMKFIGLDKKFNMYHVKVFYINLKLYKMGLECKFHDMHIKFTLEDFKHHFGIESKGNEVCILSAANFVTEEIVKFISKSTRSCLDLANFQIIQVNFEMCILY